MKDDEAMTPSIDELKLAATAPLRQAMSSLDTTAQGLCFVVDENGKLLGVLSDGDIRRHLLNGGSLDDSVQLAMNRSPVALPASSDTARIQSLLSDRIRIVPLVDADGRVIDYASARRLHQVPVLEPMLAGNELEYVSDCIRSGWLSSKGSYVARFECQLAEYIDVPHAVAVSSGTAALHLALLAAGIGIGDEVIVPNFTFAASANAIFHAGATPVLVDVCEDSWTLNPELVQRAITPRTRAIMPVHLYGHPCHMEEIIAIAREHKLRIIEDCAEALGSLYKSARVGFHGDASAFSFFGNKVITTGEGGMILFRDRELCDRARVLRDHGMRPERRYWHDCVGYNYRMTNLQAAIGVAQMERIDGLLARRAEIAHRYSARLSRLSCVSLQPIRPWAQSNNWLYTIMIEPSCPLSRDELVDKLLLNGIETRPTFCALDKMPPYQGLARQQSFPVSHRLMERGLSLPSSVRLSDVEIDNVIDCILDLLQFEDLKHVVTAHVAS